MEKNPYIELPDCLLHEEMIEYFEVVKVEKTAQTLYGTPHDRDKNNKLFSKRTTIPAKELISQNYWNISNEDIMQALWYPEAFSATFGTELVPFKGHIVGHPLL